MFTIEQIKQAHAQVQTAADFLIYIQDLITLGVREYTTFLNDGREAYFGSENFLIETSENYSVIQIAPYANKERFIEFLVIHQDGQSDYFNFCQDAAKCGIASCKVDIITMTCTYVDASDVAILIEKISV